MDTPFNELTNEQQDIILYGCDDKIPFSFKRRNKSYQVNRQFEGVIPRMERLYIETKSNYSRKYISKFMSDRKCHVCHGKRLRPEVLAVTVGGKSIADVVEMSIKDSYQFFLNLELTDREQFIAKEVLKEIRQRLKFLVDVGLDYLSMARSSGTLSGGEAQRIRLATQIGSGLVGVLYILDEPSIGLHQRDNVKLIETLKRLKNLGNTLIVVEHDEETILSADYVVDIGPGAGEHGGKVVACGTPEEIMESHESVTGQYISRRETIPIPQTRRSGNDESLIIRGARQNNLKNIDVEIPLGSMFYDNLVDVGRDSEFLKEIMKSKVSKRMVYSFVHFLEENACSINDYAEVIIALCENVLSTPLEELATQWGIERDISKLIIALYDETANSDNGLDQDGAEKCLGLWDVMFEKQIGQVRDLSRKLMER